MRCTMTCYEYQREGLEKLLVILYGNIDSSTCLVLK